METKKRESFVPSAFDCSTSEAEIHARSPKSLRQLGAMRMCPRGTGELEFHDQYG